MVVDLGVPIFAQLVVSSTRCVVIHLFVMQSVKCRQELLSTNVLMKVPFMLIFMIFFSF